MSATVLIVSFCAKVLSRQNVLSSTGSCLVADEGGLEALSPTPKPESQMQRLSKRWGHSTPEHSVPFKAWLHNISQQSPGLRPACACLSGSESILCLFLKSTKKVGGQVLHCGSATSCPSLSLGLSKTHLQEGSHWAQGHLPSGETGVERAVITGSVLRAAQYSDCRAAAAC